MSTEKDLWRTAKIMTDEYGTEAPFIAAQRIDALVALGDEVLETVHEDDIEREITFVPTSQTVMPYASTLDLPPSVRHSLPQHAQEIFLSAFNHAFAAHVGDPRQEEAAFRIAWAAVKKSYVKEPSGEWVPRDRWD